MENQNIKKTILSGVQPSGTLTIGNYLGALRNWATLQHDYNCYFCVVDLHALTVRQVPAELRQNCLKTLALYLAVGIDPNENTLFIQSHVPAHAELAWVLSCYTMFGELSRMTQFKDKSKRHADDVNSGLFTYPVLMAADILAYNADLVPVGVDQKQHLELARNIAQRFNQRYGELFTVPEPYIAEIGAKVMSLQDPTKKMSKSDENPNSCILILDDKDTIIRKFKRAVTDSDMEICYREGKDGINNLMTIYSAVTEKSFEEIEKEFAGKGYGDFKIAVGEAVADHLQPVRDNFSRLINDKAYLNECAKNGAEKASRFAQRTLNKAMKKSGLYML